MAQRRGRYKELEQYLTLAIIADAGLFILYWIVAGAGIGWLKVTLAVLCFVISVLVLAVLVLKQEVLRPRSLWMTISAGAIVLVLIFCLILNFPSPNPRDLPAKDPVSSQSQES